LLNILTYRYKGHSVADPDNTYRDAQEIEQYRQDDPIRLFADKLRAAKWLSDAEFAAIEDRAKAEVAQAHKFADESPLPDPAELTTHIYANPL
jgi:pyruvate dehydrogenase E1 component alpha subunit